MITENTVKMLLDDLAEELSTRLLLRMGNQKGGKETQISKDEFLTRKEAANMLNISLATLNKWTKRGLIPAYRLGRRVLCKRNEIENCLTKIKGSNI